MSKKRVVLIVIALAVAAFVVSRIVIAQQKSSMRQNYEMADMLFRDGKYQEAADIYRKLEDNEKLEKCNARIAFRKAYSEAEELLNAGNPAEAMERLKDYPELADPSLADHRLYREIAESLAAELLEQGEAEQAVTLLQTHAPDSYFLRDCEQALDEQRFYSLLDEGDLDAALEVFRVYKERCSGTHQFDDQLEEMASTYDNYSTHQEADNNLADGHVKLSFDQYEKMGDKAGMQAAVDALEAAGEYGDAMSCAVRMGDISKADAMFDKLAAEGGELFDNQGRLSYGSTLSALLMIEDDGARALAKKIAEAVVDECQTLVEDGYRSLPYYALEELKNGLGEMWTENNEALMAACVENMPESGIIRDNGLARQNGGLSTATITVYNNTGKSLILMLRKAENEYDMSGDSILVLVRPGKYTFTVAAGTYRSSMITGKLWFGDVEMFGVRANAQDVEIRNNEYSNGAIMGPRGDNWKDTNYLDGSYSCTVE